MNDPYTGFGYSDEEIRLLKEHDEGEELHEFYVLLGKLAWQCEECGDDSSGLMHNNTWRNVEPLLPDSYFENQGRGDLL